MTGYPQKKQKTKKKETDFSGVQEPRKTIKNDISDIPDDFLGMPNMEVLYVVQSKNHRKHKRNQFERKRKKFLKNIAENNKNELLDLGLKEEEINNMKKEGVCPKGYNVHHKLPIHGGGKNDFSNYIFMPVYEHDKLHENIIFPQIKDKPTKSGFAFKVKIPYPKEAVYRKDKQFSRPDKIYDASNYPKEETKDFVLQSRLNQR